MTSREHLAQLRATKERRLNVLELHAAAKGIDTPPEILTEIDQIKADLAAMEAIASPPVSEDVLAALNRFDQGRAVIATVMALNVRMLDMERAIDRDRESAQKSWGERKADLDTRFTTIDRRLAILLAAVIFLGVVLAVAVTRLYS